MKSIKYWENVLVIMAAGAIGLTTIAQGKPKNVISFIGDGMGSEHVKVAGIYVNGAAGTLSFELFPHVGEIITLNASNAITDSAAAGTALATGYKVYDGVISMAYPEYLPDYPEGSELPTLLEYYKLQGKSTGLITNRYMTDATPAAFGAHEPSRGNYTQIASDYLTQTRPNVLFGGSSYMSGADGEGYTEVFDRAQMQALDTETVTMVSGQFGSGDMPYEPNLGVLPHLSEMTATALSILDNEPNGFFLMVEGGLIDPASHDNNLERTVLEIAEFAEAVQVAVDWAAGRTDTLILVTADHETDDLEVRDNNGAGILPSVSWGNGKTGHTAANVPVYAWGVNAELISGVMDNTDMFGVVMSDAPLQLVSPAYDVDDVSTSPMLESTVYDPDGNEDLDVSFYGRESAFTIIVLPDTQKYVLNGAYPEIFDSQTQWIARNADALNIVFVTHEGDIVDTNDLAAEWTLANNSISLLDGFVPYGVLPGNHDKSTDTTQGTYPDYLFDSTSYNNTFPYTRYENEPWYGGHFPENGNDNSYQLFSAGGDNYIIIHLGDTPTTSAISWANGILEAHSDRKAIITTHSYIDSDGNYNGKYGSTQYIRDLVEANSNVYFVLCGHYTAEFHQTTIVDTRQVHELLADYQGRSNGGDGWLRIMRFVPAEDMVYVYTYSPWLNEYEADGNSEFNLTFPMSGGDYSVIDSVTAVPSGSIVSTEWSGLSMETRYEWYITITETSGTTVGPVWSFTTAGNLSPIANDDSAVTDEDTAVIIDVLENDNDNEDDPLTVGSVTQGANGSVVINADNTVTYTPESDFNGVDSFTYKANDGFSNSNEAMVTITVNNVDDDPPLGIDDTATTEEDIEVVIDVLGNDSDPEGAVLSVHSVTQPSNGVVINNVTDVTYSPNPDFHGSDLFTYTASDGTLISNVTTVTVTVISINDNPVANDDTSTTNEDTPVTIDVLENDTDVDTTDTLTVISVTQPDNGEVVNNGTDVTYSPNANFFGSDSFTYMVGDGNGGSDSAMVYVTVISINDPPGIPQNLSASAGTGDVTLDWDDNVEAEGDLAGYNVYRSQISGSYGDALTFVTESTYVDSEAVNETTYYYVVKAVDAGNLESGASNEVSATPVDTTYDAYVSQEPIVTFGEVTGGIEGTITVGDGIVQTIVEEPNGTSGMASLVVEYLLHTTANPAEITAMTLYLDAVWTALDGTADPLLTQIQLWDGGQWQNITGDIQDGSFIAPNPADYVDLNGDIRILFTDTAPIAKEKKDTLTIDLLYAHILSTPDTTAPAAPTALAATPGDSQVSLDWDDNTENDLDGYNVYRSTIQGGSYTKINGELVPTSDYLDSTTVNGTTYYYVVTAVDLSSNESGYSNEASATPVDIPPSAPTELVATPGDSQVSLDWDDNTENDLDGYNVYRSTTQGGGYIQINASLLPTSDYVDSTAVNGTMYYYVVTAVDLSLNESGYSNEASAMPDSQPTVHIENIDMTLVPAGQNMKAVATVLVHNQNELIVQGATVVGDWFFNDNLIATGSTGNTDDTGNAVVTSPPKKVLSGDTFTFEITDVVLAGYIYSPNDNVETQDYIVVQ